MKIPASIRSGATSSRTTAAAVRNEIGDLYDLVPQYVQFADGIRQFVSEIVDAVVVNLAWLQEQPQGGKVPIESDPDWAGFMITELTSSADGYEVGARVAVAFPDDTDDFAAGVTAESVWSQCAIDSFYTDHMVRVVNDDIAGSVEQIEKDYSYIWLTDLLPEVVSDLANDTSFSTRFAELQSWLGTIDTALADNAGDFQSYYDSLSNPNGGPATARPWKVDIDSLLTVLGEGPSTADFATMVDFAGTQMTLFDALDAQVDQWLAWWGDPATGAATFEAAYEAPDTSASDKKDLLFLVYLAYLLETAETSDYTVSQSQLVSFLENADTGDPETAEFYSTYQSVTRVANPAIYVHGSGFVGTYDGSDFCQATVETLEPASPDATVNRITAMAQNETAIATKIPSVERAATVALASQF